MTVSQLQGEPDPLGCFLVDVVPADLSLSGPKVVMQPVTAGKSTANRCLIFSGAMDT